MKGALNPAAADRLTKILGMLGSAHDGERANAAAKADQLIRSMGLTWGEIVTPSTVPDPAPRIRAWRATDNDWQRMAHFCNARRWLLSNRDRDFIRNITSQRGQPTARQQEWLLDLYARLHDGGGR